MDNTISHYLVRFKSSFQIDSSIKDSVAQELYTHLKDKIQELKGEGFSEAEADKLAVQAIGSPELIAQQIYEAHAQSNWRETLLAALPHSIIARESWSGSGSQHGPS